MAQTEQLKELDITKLVELAREDTTDKNVIQWIISRSPYWRSAGYLEAKKAIEEAGVVLAGTKDLRS